ncbi:phage virion morphogenesis protein [Pseudovibrio exalbescens]|uniref:phage virion morphogenesis protein n=1 Tax=Pseudovibrio exalbescens TaxID=197461 RepID=UPI002365F5D4|nr:phage virion morphogenesis protein [Pseudovibrio exalbescens]MDD7908558.1 phage virion morphogenesis protein [Pseudovibrio exalbescens]
MAGVGFVYDEQGVKRLELIAERLSSPDVPFVLDTLGALAVGQTQRRITQDQQAPDGSSWPEHSKGYADSLSGSQGMLHNEGDLVTSLDHVVSSDEVSWGSSLVYAAIHQFGGTIKPKDGGSLFFMIGTEAIVASEVTIPARPYLGTSDQDSREFESSVIHYMEGLLS